MTPTAGKAKVYILQTPSGSPLTLGPKSFRPTIELDGDHVVFAVSPEAARGAFAAVKQKDWKPSEIWRKFAKMSRTSSSCSASTTSPIRCRRCSRVFRARFRL